MKSFTSSLVCLPVPPPFCFRDLNPCRSGTCPAAPTAASTQQPALQPLPPPGCPTQGGHRGEPGAGLVQETELVAPGILQGTRGDLSDAPGGSAAAAPTPQRAQTCQNTKGKEKKTPLKLQGGDYLCLRNTLSLYQVGCFCYSELSAFLLCPYHEAFFCFSSSWCLYSTWHCGTVPRSSLAHPLVIQAVLLTPFLPISVQPYHTAPMFTIACTDGLGTAAPRYPAPDVTRCSPLGPDAPENASSLGLQVNGLPRSWHTSCSTRCAECCRKTSHVTISCEEVQGGLPPSSHTDWH